MNHGQGSVQLLGQPMPLPHEDAVVVGAGQVRRRDVHHLLMVVYDHLQLDPAQMLVAREVATLLASSNPKRGRVHGVPGRRCRRQWGPNLVQAGQRPMEGARGGHVVDAEQRFEHAVGQVVAQLEQEQHRLLQRRQALRPARGRAPAPEHAHDVVQRALREQAFDRTKGISGHK